MTRITTSSTPGACSPATRTEVHRICPGPPFERVAGGNALFPEGQPARSAGGRAVGQYLVQGGPPWYGRRIMLETLSRGFRNAKAKLTGVAELTEDNIEDALRDVRMSLLEADVE